MYPDEVYLSHLTPFRFLERSANIFRTKPAIVYGDRTWTYPDLRDRVNRLARGLVGTGIERGDRIAVLLPNIPQMIECHFAVPLAGAVIVAINTRLHSSEIEYILGHSGAKALIVDSEFSHLIEPIRKSLPSLETVIVVVDLPGSTSIQGLDYEQVIASNSSELLDWPLSDENDVISVNYTSGTTGRPKGVMYTHRGAYLNSLGELLETRMSSTSVYLWTLPMFHCNGWCYPWAVTAIGGTHVCLRKFDPDLAWKLIRNAGITHFCGAPTVLISLANHPSAKSGRLPGPIVVSVAAAPPSPQIIEQMENLGFEIVHVYGLSEVYGPYTVCEWQAQWNELPIAERSQIKARQGVGYLTADEARVVDSEMRDVPRDGATIGEVVMRGNNTMKGYFDDPDATERAFRGGWFHSGDLAVMHSDGYLELRDRAKDIIISGGENISTIEIEQALYAHPSVLEVAVIAIPDAKWGEAPKAFVTLRPGSSATADELIAHCGARLARFKVPRSIAFEDLPKTSTGKIQKFVLREREWSGYEKRIN